MFEKTNDLQNPPQVFAWIASLFSMGLIVFVIFMGDDGTVAVIRKIGALLLVAAFILVIVPIFLLKRLGENEESGNYMSASKVVDQGLYSILRHPQYFGYMVFNIGFILISQNYLTLLLGALGIIFFHLQVINEEKYCLDKFGAGY